MFAERVNKWIAEDNAEGIAEGKQIGKPEENLTGKANEIGRTFNW